MTALNVTTDAEAWRTITTRVNELIRAIHTLEAEREEALALAQRMGATLEKLLIAQAALSDRLNLLEGETP